MTNNIGIQQVNTFPNNLYGQIGKSILHTTRNTVTSDPPMPQLMVESTQDVILATFVRPSLTPALSLWAHVGLTITYTAIFSLLFIFIYAQMWMIWWYQHRRLSYQTVFLFLCLLWAGLRTTLFSFYFKNCKLANGLPVMFYWLLYCFPVDIQFMTLVLLLTFFAQVVFKARAKTEPCRYKKALHIAAATSVIVFTITSISSAISVKFQERNNNSVPFYVLVIRVAINDTLFLLCGIALSYCFIKIARMPSSHVVLEAKGMTLRQSVVLCTLIILLYSSRAVYNFIAIFPSANRFLPTFGYDWVNVSDQADIYDLENGYAFVSFGIVLFVWEVLPTTLVVIFFRVKCPTTPNKVVSDVSSQSQSIKSCFFDNPRRYDSDDDISRPESRGCTIPSNGTTSLLTPPLTPYRGQFLAGSHGSLHYGTPRHMYPGSPLSVNSSRSDGYSHKSSHVMPVLVHHSYPQNYYDGT